MDSKSLYTIEVLDKGKTINEIFDMPKKTLDNEFRIIRCNS